MTTSEAVRGTLSWLATYGIHSSLFLGGVWLWIALRPPRTLRNRERLWKLALLGGFASTTLQLGLGTCPPLGRIEWRVEARDESAAPSNASDTGAPLVSAPRPSDPPSTRVSRRAETPREHRTEPGAAMHAPALPDADGRFARATWPEPSLRPKAVDLARALPESTPGVPPALERVEPRRATDRTATGVAAGAEKASASDLRPVAAHAVTRWPGIVLGLWSAVGLAGLTGLAVSWSLLRRRMLGRERILAGALFERLEALRARSGYARHVRLSVSQRVVSPFSSGLLWPEICVPRAALTELTGAQQEAMLAHELAHLVRRDPTWFTLAFAIERVFFFQPLNRIARRQLSELAEVACDDWAVRWTGARLALASLLTQVASWILGDRPSAAASAGLTGHRSPLGRRVSRLLDDRRSPAGDPPARWWPALAGGALAVVALLAPGVNAAERPAPSALSARVPAESLPEPASRGDAVGPAPETAPAETAPWTEPLEASPGLAAELDELEAELALLRAELHERALEERFAPALASIDARLEGLRVQHERVRELLAALTPPTPRATGPAPAAEPLASPSLLGDSR